MSFRSLLDSWTNHEAPATIDTDYSVGLSVDGTARIHALVGLDAEHTITDLISASLDELEAGNGQET
ncbi:MAG: hypothetical protein V3R35_00385 [Woeseiaceae bacterium]|jgi:hypothetical protein